MKNTYQIRIELDPSLETYEKISEILQVTPKPENLMFQKQPSSWTYEVVRVRGDPFFDFINTFSDLLENRFQKLNSIGIPKDKISIWFLYEYDQQCNMEFDPGRLKRLGKNGITLCISCWDSGEIS